MSDEFEFEYESDGDFSQGGSDDEDEAIIQIENTFYEADDNMSRQPELAYEQFSKVVELEMANGPEIKFRFNAMQKMVILCARLVSKNPMFGDKMADHYRQLLGLMENVTRNEASDAINNVLDSVSNADDLAKLETIYQLTLDKLRSTGNQRLWFNTTVKLCKLYVESGDMIKLNRVLPELYNYCKNEDGSDDVAGKGSQVLEVYSLEIQMCVRTKNSTRLKEIYPKTMNLTSAIVDPRNIAVIRESGAKMHMSEKRWSDARTEFFESFKNYQETGNPRAKLMLKYLFLAQLLVGDDINPLDSQEAKVYADDPEITKMSQLFVAYRMNDISTVDRLMRDQIFQDEFMKTYLSELLRTIRLKVLSEVVKPYQVVSIEYLAEELNIERSEVVTLLVTLVLDNKIKAKIDETDGFVYLTPQAAGHEQLTLCQSWISSLSKLHGDLSVKVAGGGGSSAHSGMTTRAR